MTVDGEGVALLEGGERKGTGFGRGRDGCEGRRVEAFYVLEPSLSRFPRFARELPLS